MSSSRSSELLVQPPPAGLTSSRLILGRDFYAIQGSHARAALLPNSQDTHVMTWDSIWQTGS